MSRQQLGVLLLFVSAGTVLMGASLPTGRYALILNDPPVAQRFASAKGGAAAGAPSYRQQIAVAQTALRQALGIRKVRVTGATQTLLNAVYVAASPAQVAQLKSLPGVKDVVPLHRYKLRLDRAVQLTNVPAAWSQLGGTGHAGAGIKIAIIDSGIDQNHPGFQDSSLQPPTGFPRCDIPANCAFTNNKVIVVRSYVPLLAAGSQPNPALDSRPDDVSPRDHVGHGTALGMIAAGVTNSGPGDTITGVAPKAFLGSYKIFGSPGVNDFTFGDVIIQALEDAQADGMDVAVLSLGGPAITGPLDQGAICGLNAGSPCDPEAQAVETAVHAGMNVVAAAGNEGDTGFLVPTYGTIDSPGTSPSAIAAGATTNSHVFFAHLHINGANVPSNLQTVAAAFGDGPPPAGNLTAPLRDATPLDGTGLACSPFPAGSLTGTIAIVQRGICNFSVKVINAQNVGAVGVIVIQASGQGAIFGPGALGGTSIPAAMISDADGANLLTYLASNSGATGTMDPTLQPADVSLFNEVASFSSHGPSIDMRLKPEMVAVGTDMYMAAQRFDVNGVMYDPTGYTVQNGTSFAVPMVAGALALVKQANPGFTPLQLKSALVNTATQDVTESGFQASVVATGNGKLSAADATQVAVTVDPTAVSWGALTVGTPPPAQTITIHYAGQSSGTLTLAAVALAGNPPALDKTSISVAPGRADTTVTLSLPATVPAPGIYEGGITIQGVGSGLRVPYMYVVGDGVPSDIVGILTGGFDGIVNQSPDTGGFAFRVIDDFGVPVAGVPVSFGVLSGGGSILSPDSQTNSEGVATAGAVLGPVVGTQSFFARIPGLGSIRFDGTAHLQPTIQAVTDSASLAVGPVSPGAYMTLWGQALSDTTDGTRVAALPLSIDAVSVSFDVPSANPPISVPGRMLFVSPGQINVQAPFELSGQQSVMVKVTVADSPGAVFTAPVQEFLPAVYLVPDPGNSQRIAAALDLNNALISSQNPAHRGQTIQLYLNGLGSVTNPPAIGFVARAQPLSQTIVQPTVTIGNKPASVLFSGLTPTTSGLYQINLTLAQDTPTGLQPLVVSIGGVSSAPVNIQVQ